MSRSIREREKQRPGTRETSGSDPPPRPDTLIQPRSKRSRKLRIEAGAGLLMVGLLGFVFYALFASHSGSADSAPTATYSLGRIGGSATTVTVLHSGLRNSEVDLLGLPAGYRPRISPQQALEAAIHQLAAGMRPRTAHLYLGRWPHRGAEYDRAVWVAVFPGVACQPVIGPSPQPGFRAPSSRCGSQGLGVVLDARTGTFIVAGSG